ncbi:unnamed protein product, partial [marine sediment metagenome]
LEYLRHFAPIGGEVGLVEKINRKIEEYNSATGEEQFYLAMTHGFLPTGSVYVPDPEDPGKFSYFPPQVISAIKKASPELHETLITEGYKAYETELIRLSREYEAYQEALDKLKPFEVRAFTKPALEYGAKEFERWVGKPVPPEEYEGLFTSYDLVAAIKAGNLEEVEKLFPPEAVKAAQDLIEVEERAVALEVARGAPDTYWYQGRKITEAQRNDIIESWKNERDRLDK